MQVSKIAGIAVATLVLTGPAVFAQTAGPATAGQPPTSPATQPLNQTKSADSAAIQTFTGCLMTEPAYRKAHNLGEGALGGVGLGDEFVLVDVTVAPAKAGAAEPRVTTPQMAAEPNTSMTTCADKGTAYRLTGTQEDKMKGLVGHELEVTGRFKHADDAAAGGTRPDEKLPAEVEIVSYREAPAPAAVTEPARPTPPPATPPPTVEPQPQPRPAPPPAAMPATPAPERKELPHTAGSDMLVGLVGVLAFTGGVAMLLLRRRVL